MKVWAIHRFHPDKSSPNSVTPVCAAFTLIQEPTATATATNTGIPATATPTATLPPATETPEPTATIEPTETPKPPTPTNDPIPTYCNPDTGNCTNAGNG